MIVIIPLGGTGQRFSQDGYMLPKALINVNNKSIIFHLIDNLSVKHVKYVCIPYNNAYVEHGLEKILTERYPSIKFIFFVLETQTRGAAETVKISIDHIYNNHSDVILPTTPVLCLDADNFYTFDIINSWDKSNTVFTIKECGLDAKFSYVSTEEDNTSLIINNIIEKNKISDNACVGAYGFEKISELHEYASYILDNNILQKGEFYISGIIKQMILKNKIFSKYEIENKNYFSLGTPEQVNLFEKTFLLDLDGTLINTDPIYTEVWKELLLPYNITCNEEFFHTFIKGKSDVSFLKFIKSDLTSENIVSISKDKDLLFEKFLKNKINNNEDLMFEGVLDFFQKIQNSHIAIVTSCNMYAVNTILECFNLNRYINLVIASESVPLHKPSPEPYLYAAKMLNRNISNCIIFEDSYSGYMSANNSSPFKIYMYNNGTNGDMLSTLTGVTILSSYNEFDVKDITETTQPNKSSLIISKIKNSLDYLPLKDVTIDEGSNIKTGYICDINRYDIQFFNNKHDKLILKISNLNNSLSDTATKMDIYNNERYFYETITKSLSDLKTPKCFGCFTFEGREAIIMEDVTKTPGTFNMNLNTNIDLLLKVVTDIFSIHSKYYFEHHSDVIECLKPLKTISTIGHLKNLVHEKFDLFFSNVSKILSDHERSILLNIHKHFDKILKTSSSFPLSLCHGDVKSPNIYYKNDGDIMFLDWQYVHMNKGINDVTFLLVESVDFDKLLCDTVINYYYLLCKNTFKNTDYNKYIHDFKCSLCIFPFFVSVWFNSEDQETLIDKCFPIKFLKTCLKYYTTYLDNDFFTSFKKI